jgi:alpha-beta hydrolase superfamily lysophospholipase
MRALHPDQSGYVDRDGVPIYYEVFGAGEPTLLLVPPSPITDSRIWKALIPYLARHYRVVTLDGRGNGRSGRPTETAAHARAQNERDIVAVLDATGTAAAVVIAHCHANWWAIGDRLPLPVHSAFLHVGPKRYPFGSLLPSS